MRIKQISITKLFGIFDHVIPLNLDERITIIHGINGVGKTSILGLINGFFRGQYSDLLGIPFEEFRLEFDNDNDIVLKQKIFRKGIILENTKLITTYLYACMVDHGKKSKDMYLDHSMKVFDLETSEFLCSLTMEDHKQILLGNAHPFLNYFSENVINESQQILAQNKSYESSLISTFDNLQEREVQQKQTTRGELQKIKELIFLKFIECQRLVSVNNSSAVIENAEELSQKIELQLSEYGKVSQSLDRTFPVRVIQGKESQNLTEQQLRQKLSNLETKRHQLINVGLLEKTEDSNFLITDNLDESTRKFLSLYVEDTEKKLNIFSDFAYRLELFQRIINQRFTYKTLVINQDKGFILKTNQGEVLSPTDLSSGEQHELVMLYELLFKTKPGSLILIDEPEISLHVGWQVKFLEDLQEIAKLANIDILLATHSPDIINGRWDLTVELKGLSNERVHSTKS
jgi:predicted ATP-binding protein involved in virulence